MIVSVEELKSREEDKAKKREEELESLYQALCKHLSKELKYKPGEVQEIECGLDYAVFGREQNKNWLFSRIAEDLKDSGYSLVSIKPKWPKFKVERSHVGIVVGLRID